MTENEAQKPGYRLLLDWIAPQASVLDLGCGDGELLELLVRERGVRAQGVEIDEQKVYQCVARGLSVLHGDIDTGLPEYGDATFDYVVLYNSLEQVRKPHAVLQEALRVGRRVIVRFPNFGHYSVRFQILLRGRTPVTPGLPYHWYDTPNLHFLSIADFEDYCRQNNVRAEKSAFDVNGHFLRVWPNMLAEKATFLISKEEQR
jgi:methionine biosynthesis protein MetW